MVLPALLATAGRAATMRAAAGRAATAVGERAAASRAATGLRNSASRITPNGVIPPQTTWDSAKALGGHAARGTIGQQLARDAMPQIGGRHSWEGANREVLGGIQPNYDWRNFQLRPLSAPGSDVDKRLKKLEGTKSIKPMDAATTPKRTTGSTITTTSPGTTSTTAYGGSEMYQTGARMAGTRRSDTFQSGVVSGMPSEPNKLTGTQSFNANMPGSFIAEMPGFSDVQQKMKARARQGEFRGGLQGRQSTFYDQMLTKLP